jgi:pyrroloquinoline quinone biosynthesis protein D
VSDAVNGADGASGPAPSGEGEASAKKPRLTRKVRLKFDPIEKQFLLLYPERGMKLSDSAAEILQRCDGERTVDKIAAELAYTTGTPLAIVRQDVLRFVEEMRTRGLVELV